MAGDIPLKPPWLASDPDNLFRVDYSSSTTSASLQYAAVDPSEIEEDLQSLREGGVPPMFLIIDDGSQGTVDEIKELEEALCEHTVFVQRLGCMASCSCCLWSQWGGCDAQIFKWYLR
jgi:hypothetical protein